MSVFKMSEVTVKELFRGALVPTKLADLKLNLNKKTYCKEQGQFLAKKAKNTIKTEITINKDESKAFIDAVVKCEDGNPQVDIRSLYNPLDAGKQIMVVKHMKHGLSQQEAKNCKTISFAVVKDWLAKAKNLLATYESHYQIIYVFITNKKITRIIAPDTLQWPEDLIVVHQPILLKYFGPSVFQIATLCDEELNL